MVYVLPLSVLYRTNMFFPESSLWTRDRINENLIRKTGGSEEIDFHSDQLTLDKTSHMDIDASLEMDFMSGLRRWILTC